MTVQKIMTPEGREFHLQLPERVECGEVTLKRGLTTDTGLWDWREKVVTGNVTEARVDCTITMFDSENMPVVTWKLVNAWPSRISGPHIGLDSNDFAVEELIIVHEGLYWHDGVDSMPMFEPAD